MTLLMIAAAGVTLGGIIVVVRRKQRLRVQSLERLAERLGWGFRDSVPFDGIPGLDRFELFRQGRGRTLSNLMTSPDAAVRLVVFDYTYRTGGGNSQQMHRQTVCYLTSDTLALPSFSLRPEHFYHRIAGAFGYRDIDFEHRPAFSNAFVLRGEDEATIRDAFTDDVAQFFEDRQGTCAAGVGRELLFWRTGGLLPAAEREALVAEALDLAGRFAPAN